MRLKHKAILFIFLPVVFVLVFTNKSYRSDLEIFLDFQHNEEDKSEVVDESTQKPKIVLYWKDRGLSNLYDWGLGLMCNGRCLFTNDTEQLPHADAVIPEKNLFMFSNRLPKRYNTKQIFIASRYEAPSKYGSHIELHRRMSQTDTNNYFNLTLSYRQDADVVIKYHRVLPRSGLTQNLNLPKRNDTRKQAVWITSNCRTRIQREQFVKKLQQHNITIDIYGKCGIDLQDTCPKKDAKNKTDRNSYCMHDIVKNYKFYIAFENSLCEDYLTEKAAQFMELPSLPIIMSYTKLDKLLPPNSYINVFDYTSVKELADYIKYLDNNYGAYLQHFQWRHKWRTESFLKVRPTVKCDLCDLLHTNVTKRYGNLADWFAGPITCSADGLSKHFTDFK